MPGAQKPENYAPMLTNMHSYLYSAQDQAYSPTTDRSAEGQSAVTIGKR